MGDFELRFMVFWQWSALLYVSFLSYTHITIIACLIEIQVDGINE